MQWVHLSSSALGGAGTQAVSEATEAAVEVGLQMASIPPPSLGPPPGVELHRASRMHPQQTTVLGVSTIDDEELDRMVREGKIPFRAVAWSPLEEEVSKRERVEAESRKATEDLLEAREFADVANIARVSAEGEIKALQTAVVEA